MAAPLLCIHQLGDAQRICDRLVLQCRPRGRYRHFGEAHSLGRAAGSAAISKRCSLLSRRSLRSAPLLRKEIRELATGSSLWVLLLLLSPLVGYSFIQAVALTPGEPPALSIPELARQLSPSTAFWFRPWAAFLFGDHPAVSVHRDPAGGG